MNKKPASHTFFSLVRRSSDERGVALLLTIFVLALGTLLVFELSQTTILDQRISRAFAEEVQSDLLLKSALNLSTKVFEIPTKNPNVVSLLDPWSAIISSLPSLPIDDGNSEIKLLIVDESSKINLNNLVSANPSPQQPQPGQPQTLRETFWRNGAASLFKKAGFQQAPADRRTPGKATFSAEDQVAVIVDWIDRDSDSFASPDFGGQGKESQMGKSFFANRPLEDLSELLLVPGFTPERFQRVAPFFTARVNRGVQVNINTAPPEVLDALVSSVSPPIPASVIKTIATQRLTQPFDQPTLNQLGVGGLLPFVTTNSRTFTAYARVKTPNRTRWATALLEEKAGGGSGLGRPKQVARRALY